MDVVRALFMSVWSEVVSEGLGDLSESLHEHHRLDELDVTELRVPVNVGRAHQDVLTNLLTRDINVYLRCYQDPL